MNKDIFDLASSRGILTLNFVSLGPGNGKASAKNLAFKSPLKSTTQNLPLFYGYGIRLYVLISARFLIRQVFYPFFLG